VRARGPLDRTERRRGAHLFGLKAESLAVLLLRLKGYSILVIIEIFWLLSMSYGKKSFGYDRCRNTIATKGSRFRPAGRAIRFA
jgi:hypothetical protein